MRWSQPGAPSPRNSAIFAAVEAGQTQAEVAEEHGLSQAQVSRICRRVVAWLARQRVSEALPAPEAIWLAHRREVAKLRGAERDAREALEQTCAPRVETESNGTTETRRTKSPQASPSLLGAYVRCAKEVRKAEVAEVQAAELLRAALLEDAGFQEEVRVEQELESITQLRAAVVRLERRGVATPPIPKLSRRQLADEIRQKLRGSSGATLTECKPDAWQAIEQFLEERREVYSPRPEGHLGAAAAHAGAAQTAVAATTSAVAVAEVTRPKSPAQTGINRRVGGPAGCPGPRQVMRR